MKYHSTLFVSLCLLLIGFSAAQAQSKKAAVLSPEKTDQFLKSMSDSLSRVETLQADFVQKRTLTVFMDTLVSSGRFYFKVPDKLRWEVKQSFHTILITNSGRVAKFDFQNNRIRKLKIGAQDIMKEIMKQIIFWMKGDFSASSAIYTITLERSAGLRSAHIIRLEPKSAAMRENLSQISLHVSEKNRHITRVTLHETGMGITQIFFSDEIVNRSFDAGLFDLNDPLLENLPCP